VRLTGTFEHLKARSVPAQTRPYPPLAKAVAEQSVFDLGRVRGTMVGFRCPKNVGGLNVPGWHFHFISEKDPAGKRSGGHVLARAGRGGHGPGGGPAPGGTRVAAWRGLRRRARGRKRPGRAAWPGNKSRIGRRFLIPSFIVTLGVKSFFT
jgi:hypothetical protein